MGRVTRLSAPLVAALVLALVGTLLLGDSLRADPGDAQRKAEVDGRLAEVQQQLQRARGREDVLTDQVSAYTDKIRQLEEELRPLRQRAALLRAESERLRQRLDALTERLEIEQRRLARAQDALAQRQRVLADRLRTLYARGEPDPLMALFESGSLSGAVETAGVINRIARQDSGLVEQVGRYADDVRQTRDRIAEVRADAEDSERRARAATEAAEAAKADLERERAVQAELRSERRDLLQNVRGDRENIEAEARNLQARSAALGDRIRAAQAAAVTQSVPSAGSAGASPSPAPEAGPPPPASSSGFVFPASGTITSGFGPRWGRMHEGVDIAGASGSPIRAASSGTVILAGWQGGYGNLVVLDHGGGLSTAYAHLSSIGVGVGQAVGQGATLGGMGTTGNSTGVHLHFEVRINGRAVNPMSYL